MNNTVREELYKTLCDLLEKQFKDFKWWLKGIDYNEKPNIVTASLEKANQQEVVDLLIHYYGEDAPKVCIRVLQKSNINDVARKLEETLQKDVDAHQLPDSSDHGSSNYSPRASYDPLKPLIQPMQDHEAAPSTSLNPPTGPHHSAMFRTDLCEQELEGKVKSYWRLGEGKAKNKTILCWQKASGGQEGQKVPALQPVWHPFHWDCPYPAPHGKAIAGSIAKLWNEMGMRRRQAGDFHLAPQ
ncbi:uncharacterized protein LOC116513895 [Thamnophis elegans]|uniref:uncharacterized protein LOC116513895 n=1 Tax=Thamnophis elegans TaxID=35005 RepID=UPI001378ABC9|nr:uncharacterized protein LOC116513895 [Thamnophis elegans]